jgi:ATP-binding cassette subfamily F protein 3
MILFDVADIRKRFSAEPLLEGVTFELRPGDRAGLVGPNGCGKTTLLRILAGREEADAGRCLRHPSVRCGYLEQQPVFAPGRTLRDEARSALADLLDLQREAEAAAAAIAQSADESEHRRLAARYDHLQHELARQDAFNLDHRIERVLDGLRFSRASFDQPAASLSGGEQNRLMLAKLLLAEPNVMILDEPSNHLDVEAAEWLEEFLLDSSAAMILVSHDRWFLDRVATRTLELFAGTVVDYAGNFSAYWRQKQERLLVERRTYQRQQEEMEKAREFIRRNAYGQKHAQAEDRRKKLERIEPVPPPREIAAPPMRFPPAARSGDIVARAVRATKAFDRPLFRDLTFDIIRGQRWALLGPNGSGKTTLLKCLLGLMPIDAGEIGLGHGVEVGYFDQQLSGMDETLSAVDAVDPRRKLENTEQRRGLLARFGLTGEAALQPVGSLSGGQRCRAALARLAAEQANFLVLDEPTNHLDLWARDALEKALLDFDGAVLLVSHDRYFVNRVADHLLLIEPDRVRVIEGNYDTYRMMLSARQAGDEVDDTAGRRESSASNNGNKTDKPSSARKRRFPYRKVAEIEAEIIERETAVHQLHHELTDPAVLRDGPRGKEIKARIESEQAAIKLLYAHWEEAAELNW